MADPLAATGALDPATPRSGRASERRSRGRARPAAPQPVVVAVALALTGLGFAWLTREYGGRHGALLLVGAACGATLFLAAFGFTAAFRAFVTTGDGRGVRAQMLMLGVATVLFAPILSRGEILGAGVSGAVAPAGVAVFVGAFMFAVGMQLGGGCGSGTLFHLGGGSPAMLVTLGGFIVGSVAATFHAPFWWATPALPAISLGETLGWPLAVSVQLGLLAMLAGATVVVERRRRGGPAVSEPLAAPPTRSAGRPYAQPGRGARIIEGPWPLALGGVVLAILNTLTLMLAGHPWGITWAFALWGAKLLDVAGYDLAAVPFWSGEFQQDALAAPVLADVTSVMDIGIVLGALLAAGVGGRFAPVHAVRGRVVVSSLLGGLLLGYGARVAFGCNIGAYFSGIASTSLHGWLWGVAALLGTPAGVRLRRILRGE